MGHSFPNTFNGIAPYYTNILDTPSTYRDTKEVCYIYEAVLSHRLSVNAVRTVLIGDGSTYTREDLAV